MWTDDTVPIPKAKQDDDDPESVFKEPSFGFGDETRTLPVTRNFGFENGMRNSVPGTVGVARETFRTPPSDPLGRIEKILERAMTSLDELQRRIESIETTIEGLHRR